VGRVACGSTGSFNISGSELIQELATNTTKLFIARMAMVTPFEDSLAY
jgi:hypothetical protein